MTTLSTALLTQEALNQARQLLDDMVILIAQLQRHGYLTAITATTFVKAARQIDEELLDAYPFDQAEIDDDLLTKTNDFLPC